MTFARQQDGWVPALLAETNSQGFQGDGDLDLRISTAKDRTWVVWEQAPGTLSWSALEPDGSWAVPPPESVTEPGGGGGKKPREPRSNGW